MVSALGSLDGPIKELSSSVEDAHATIIQEADDATRVLWNTFRNDIEKLKERYQEVLTRLLSPDNNP